MSVYVLHSPKSICQHHLQKIQFFFILIVGRGLNGFGEWQMVATKNRGRKRQKWGGMEEEEVDGSSVLLTIVVTGMKVVRKPGKRSRSGWWREREKNGHMFP